MQMTPEEKAKELVQKFKAHSYYDAHDLTTRSQREASNIASAVECALIAVDEIVQSATALSPGIVMEIGSRGKFGLWSTYWELVKQEIEKL